MGNIISNIHSQSFNNKVVPKHDEKIKKVMPVYYTTEEPTHLDYINANNSWKLITDNNSTIQANIYEKKEINITCIHLFYETFYDKLFYVFPDIKNNFKRGVHNQGRMLVQMITILLQYLYNHDILIKLEELTIAHISFGVKTHHFYIAGDVLLHSLDTVLMEYFVDDYFNAWRKIYSSMLRIIIPIIDKNENNRIINSITNHYEYHYNPKSKPKKKVFPDFKDIPESELEKRDVNDTDNLTTSIVSHNVPNTFVYQTVKRNQMPPSNKKSSKSSKFLCNPKDIFSPNVSFIEPVII